MSDWQCCLFRLSSSVLETWLDYTGELEPPEPLARLPQLKHSMKLLLTELAKVQQIALCCSTWGRQWAVWHPYSQTNTALPRDNAVESSTHWSIYGIGGFGLRRIYQIISCKCTYLHYAVDWWEHLTAWGWMLEDVSWSSSLRPEVCTGKSPQNGSVLYHSQRYSW